MRSELSFSRSYARETVTLMHLYSFLMKSSNQIYVSSFVFISFKEKYSEMNAFDPVKKFEHNPKIHNITLLWITNLILIL